MRETSTALLVIRGLITGRSEGSREIDARLHHLLSPDEELMVSRSAGQEVGRVRDVPIDGWTDYGPLASQFCAEWYSSSADHAIALSRRVLPLWRLGLSIPGYIEGYYQDGRPVAVLESPISSGGGPRWLVSESTVALSVLGVLVDVLLDGHDHYIRDLLGSEG